MKRCPECEFVYEDEQHTCDMDGAELIFDLSFGSKQAAVQTGLQNNKAIEVSLLVVDSVAKRRSNWLWRAGVAMLVCLLSGAASFLLFDVVNRGERSKIVQTNTPSRINPHTASPDNTDSVMTASLVDDADKSTDIAVENKEFDIEARGQFSPKIVPMTEADKSKRGGRRHLNHIARSEKRAESEPNPKIIGPTTTVKTEKLSNNGAAITTRADGPRRSVLRSASSWETEKKESRFGSFIKTTGRMIKRPFKF